MQRAGAGLRTVVAVLTYRRTALLPDLLTALLAQVEATTTGVAQVLVVDNDPEGGAAAVVGSFAGRGVRYVHEPRPGISAARNRALDESAGADLLVFFDDDQRPSPGWLARLTGAWLTWDCAAVAGPVDSVLPDRVDPWITGSGTFAPVERSSGSRVRGAGAGNLLLDLRRVRALGLRFDERLGLTGGEDTLFTHALVHAGEEIRWCAEAGAEEPVPPERLTRRWVLRRCFRSGSSWSRAELQLAGTRARRWALRGSVLVKAAVRLVLASAAWLGAVLAGQPGPRGRAAAGLAGYAGLVAGAFGFVLDEYARTPVPVPAAAGTRTPDRAEAVTDA